MFGAIHCSIRNSVYWECSARGTSRGRRPASVVQKLGEFRLRRGPSEHIHAAVAGLHATVALTAEVRRTARDDVLTPASAIVATALTHINVISGTHNRRPNVKSMVGV